MGTKGIAESEDITAKFVWMEEIWNFELFAVLLFQSLWLYI